MLVEDKNDIKFLFRATIVSPAGEEHLLPRMVIPCSPRPVSDDYKSRNVPPASTQLAAFHIRNKTIQDIHMEGPLHHRTKNINMGVGHERDSKENPCPGTTC